LLDNLELSKQYYLSQINRFQFFAGYVNGCTLDPSMVLYPPGGSAGPYGYWLQPAPDGCLGLLFLGYWMTTYTNRITDG
jgi:hypothetical protein